MKKCITLLMLAFAFSLFVNAQSEQTGASNGPMTITGCIAEKDGQYMMINKNHPEGVLLSSAEDIKPHVGHKMSVTGKMMRMDQTSGSSMSSDQSAKGNMGMRVSSMKMMSDHCDDSE